MSKHHGRRRPLLRRFGRSGKQPAAGRAGRTPSRSRISLGLESLESRLVLSSMPILTSPLPTPDEGDAANVSFQFTDSVATTGGSIGLDPESAAYTSFGNFDPTSNIVIDTTNLTISGSLQLADIATADVGYGSYEIAVFVFDTFELYSGITITATGSRPLALLSKGSMTIAGVINVSAVAGEAGAGGGAGGVLPTLNGGAAAGSPVNPLDPNDPTSGYGRNFGAQQGGGGGGFGGVGGGGSYQDGVGNSGVAPTAGASYGDLALGIQGGSGGAMGVTPVFQAFPFRSGRGGGGGGGVELGAVDDIIVSGQILANGANGAGGGGSGTHVGGGGGAGGGILVHGTTVSIAASGVLSANGGNGWGVGAPFYGGGGGGGGRILIAHDAETAGSYTNLGTMSAAGGASFSTNSDPGAAGVVAVQAVTDVAVNEEYSFVINWGDGSPDSTGSSSGGEIAIVSGTGSVTGTFGASHTYADGDASYVITVTVTDDQGDAVDSFVINVANVAPDLMVTGAATVEEGAEYTLALGASDQGDDTISSWTINWGDGSETTVAGDATSVAHTYADGDNNYEITATATDEDGEYDAASIAVLVVNVAPMLTVSGNSEEEEGNLYTLNLAASDQGDDTISSWTINWGDGSEETVSGGASVATHIYGDEGVYSISVSATDEDGNYSALPMGVTVNNVAPTADAGGPYAVDEGGSVLLTATGVDVPADALTFEWDLDGDGQYDDAVGASVVFDASNLDGTTVVNVGVRVSDGDGGEAFASSTVTVNNVAPTADAGGPYAVDEGGSVTLTATGTDVPADALAFEWDLDGDGQYDDAVGASVVFDASNLDGTTVVNVGVRVSDGDGGEAFASSTVTVNNVAPTADAGGPYLTFDDTPITLQGAGTDPAGTLDPLTLAWDLDGDGVYGETGSGAARGDEVGANPVFNPAGLSGTFTVSLRVTDGDGGVTFDTAQIQVLKEGTLLIDNTLYIVGSNTRNDIAIITKIGSQLVVIATFNDDIPMTFDSSQVTDIQVRMRGGNDIVATTSNVMQTMTIDGGNGNDLLTGGGGSNTIYGGAGNDVLYGAGGDDRLFGGDGNDDLFGGSGNDVLVGGGGNDILDGGEGLDLLIGGQNNDRIVGGGDEDILVGGFTSHDENLAALDAVMAIWNSAASFTSRVNSLTAAGGLLQAGVTVFDDDDNDNIDGGVGRDLIFGDNYKWDGSIDRISLQTAQDVLVAVT